VSREYNITISSIIICSSSSSSSGRSSKKTRGRVDDIHRQKREGEINDKRKQTITTTAATRVPGAPAAVVPEEEAGEFKMEETATILIAIGAKEGEALTFVESAKGGARNSDRSYHPHPGRSQLKHQV